MGKYNIVFTKSAIKDLERIPKKELQRMLSRIDKLSEDPRPQASVKLTKREEYRLRQGKYRILYDIKDSELIVYVVKVAHRRLVYLGH